MVASEEEEEEVMQVVVAAAVTVVVVQALTMAAAAVPTLMDLQSRSLMRLQAQIMVQPMAKLSLPLFPHLFT
jgi:Tfp pilus assembly PilM family ATPase